MNNVPLVDVALAAVERATDEIAVNVHHGRQLMESHLAGRVHMSFEDEQPLGTAGAVGHLRDWLDGRGVLIVNADTWHQADLATFLAGWDGERIRLLLGGDRGVRLGASSIVCASLLPWSEAVKLTAEPAGLYEVCWRPAVAEGRVEETWHDGPVIPCDTPMDYLTANLTASNGTSVIGAGSLIEGEVDQCVVWPASHVRPEERLHRAIRVGKRLTVMVR